MGKGVSGERPGVKESPGCLLGGTRARRVPRRPLQQRERQGEAGSEEGACAPILQQPSKDKAESERERVRGEGGCGERQERGVTLETLGNWHLTLRGPGRLRRVRTAAIPHCSQSSLPGLLTRCGCVQWEPQKTAGQQPQQKKGSAARGPSLFMSPVPATPAGLRDPCTAPICAWHLGWDLLCPLFTHRGSLPAGHRHVSAWGLGLPPTCPRDPCAFQDRLCSPQAPNPHSWELWGALSPPRSVTQPLQPPQWGCSPPQPSPGHLGELRVPLPPAHSPRVPLHVTSGLVDPPSPGLAGQGCRMWVFLWVL